MFHSFLFRFNRHCLDTILEKKKIIFENSKQTSSQFKEVRVHKIKRTTYKPKKRELNNPVRIKKSNDPFVSIF